MSALGPLVGFAPLLLAFAALRLVPPTGRPLTVRQEAALCAFAVVTSTVLAGWWLAGRHLGLYGVDGSDHLQYCEAVDRVRSGARGGITGGQRSVVAALLPATIARWWGVFDGLALASVLSFTAIALGSYLWTRAVASPVAAATSALLCAGLELVSATPRTLNFYPEINAACLLASAAAAWALVSGRMWSFPLAGAAIGVALLMDVRALIWALPCLGIALLGTLRAPWRHAPVRAALLVALVAASFPLGRFAWHDQAGTLEHMVSVLNVGPSPGEYAVPGIREGGYVWGHSNPLRLFETLRFVAGVRPPNLVALDPPNHGRMVGVWFPALGLFGMLAAAGTFRDPRRLIALVGTLLPWMTSLVQSGELLPQSRFLQTGFCAVPTLVAVGLGALAGVGDLRRAALAAALTVAFDAGWLPSSLTPIDAMRMRDGAGLAETVRNVIEHPEQPDNRACALALAHDRALGIQVGQIRVFGVDLLAPPPETDIPGPANPQPPR